MKLCIILNPAGEIDAQVTADCEAAQDSWVI
jgi:hypothetical protein